MIEKGKSNLQIIKDQININSNNKDNKLKKNNIKQKIRHIEKKINYSSKG